MTDIHGINLAMQTPFDDAGGVDYAGFERLLDQYLETGLHGYVTREAAVCINRDRSAADPRQ